MSPSYEVVSYRPEFRDQVIELQKHLWSQDTALNAEYFDWKYEGNPFVSHVPIYLAVFDDQVVGMRGFMGAEWQVGTSSDPFRCLCACDLVVTPSHRGRGLFRKIMAPAMKDLSDRGHPMALNLSASPITFLSSLKTGWQLVGRYRAWHWQTRSKTVATVVHKLMDGKLGLWRFADRRLPLIERNNPDGLRRLANYFDGAGPIDGMTFRYGNDPDMDQMIALRQGLIPDDGRIRHTMGKDYLEWRYQNPASEFAFLYAGDQPLKGYLVLHRKKLSDPDDISIADWQADSPDTLCKMIHAVQGSGAVDRLIIWSATLSEDVVAVLRSLSFQAFDDTRGIQGFTPGVIYSPTGTQTTEQVCEFTGCNLSDLATWDLRMIYSDFY